MSELDTPMNYGEDHLLTFALAISSMAAAEEVTEITTSTQL